MNWIKSKIVRLPSDEFPKNGDIVLLGLIPDTLDVCEGDKESNEYCVKQHLYFTSDEKIKEGDWVLFDKSDWQVELDYNIGRYVKTLPIKYSNKVIELICIDEKEETCISVDISTIKKIIATTDPKLNLPQPPQVFIREYCDAGGIDEVMVEMELRNVSSDRLKEQFDEGKFLDIVTKEFQIKINLDNTINIRKIKDSWSREEVKELMQKSWHEAEVSTSQRLSNTVTFDRSGCIKWIEKNL